MRKLLCLFYVTFIFAQNYHVTNYDFRNGLPAWTINDIIQDDEGLIWIATPAGIHFYDGDGWKKPEKWILTVIPQRKFFRSEKGEIWSLPLFGRDFIRVKRNNGWEEIAKLNNQRVFVDFAVLKENGKEKIITLQDDGRLFLFDGNWLELSHGPEGLETRIYSIFIYKKEFYVCSEEGILKLKNEKFSAAAEFDFLPRGYIPKHVFISAESIYFLDENSLREYKDQKTEVLADGLHLRKGVNNVPASFVYAPDGSIYFGNENIMYLYSPEKNTVKRLDSLVEGMEGGCLGITIDYENNIWITSGRGIKKIRKVPFENIKVDESSFVNEIASLVVDKKNRTIFGQTGRLSVYENSELKKIKFENVVVPADMFARVMDMDVDNRGDVWVVGFKVGLGILQNDRLKWVYRDESVDLNSVVVTDKYEVILGANNGVFKYTGSGLESLDQDFKHHTRKVKIFQDGSIVACTPDKGIFIFTDGGNIQNIVSKDGKYNNTYNVIEHSVYGTLVAARNGLCKIDNGQIIKFEEAGFKIDWPVYFIFEDSAGFTWFGTQNGIIKWDGENSVVYNSSSGLAGDEANRSAVAEDGFGNVWVGTSGGAIRFDPNAAIPDIHGPKGQLISIESSDGRIIKDFSNLEFEQGASLTFNLRSYSFIDETKKQFSLELRDQDGNIINKSSLYKSPARYVSIQPGSYTWTMNIVNPVEVESRDIEVIKFRVLTPFVQSATFRFLIILAGAIILLVIYYNITRVRRTKKLQELVEIKTSELNRNLEEKSQVEKELLDSEKTLKMMTNSTYEGIAIHKQGMLVLVNKQLTEMFGYSEEELIGSNSLQYFAEADHGIIIGKIKSSEEECYRVSARKKNGTLFPVEMRSHPANYKGEKVRVVAVRDITETVEFEKTLLYKNQFEKMISEISSNFINLQPQQISDHITLALSRIANFINADSGYILLFHDNGKKMSVTNLWQNEKIHLDINKLQDLDVYEMPVWCKLLLNGEPVNFPNISELGEEAAIEKKILSALDIGSLLDIPIMIEGQTVGVIGFDSVNLGREWSEDEITKLRLAGQIFFNALTRKKYVEQIVVAKDKAEASDKLKTEFLAQMSHEIRTPINVMLNYLSLVEEKVGNEKDIEMQYCFDGVDNAGRRIIRTIDSILNVSELQQGLYDYRPRNIDLKEIAQNLILEHKSTAMGKKLTLELLTDLNSAYVNIDEYSITQTLANLIDNAIKYTENGGVSVKMFRTGEGELITEVTDTGIGIAEDFLKNLFNPFSQEEQGYTRKYEGNGLGLTLVKKYCEMNNTEIEVESIKSSGTTFRLKFNGQS